MASEKPCVVCGTVFNPKTSLGKYCSDECFRKRPRAPWKPRGSRVCEVCGKTYGYTYPQQRTCGRTCGLKIYTRKPTPPKPPRSCEICGTDLPPKSTRRVCGPACRKMLPKKPRPPSKPRIAKYAHTCAICSSTFMSPNETLWRSVCSQLCRDRQRYDRTVPPDHCACGTPLEGRERKCERCVAANALRAAQRRRRIRRARERGALSEEYSLADIALRDGYRCGLCNRKVNMNLTVPHRRAPTIDHVLPLSCGGDDTRANVQLAHFICNSLKSAGGSQQLALLG